MHQFSQSQVFLNLYERVQSIAKKLQSPGATSRRVLPLPLRYRISTERQHAIISPIRDLSRTPTLHNKPTSHLLASARTKPRSLSPIVPRAASQPKFRAKIESRRLLPSLNRVLGNPARRKEFKDASDSTDSLMAIHPKVFFVPKIDALLDHQPIDLTTEVTPKRRVVVFERVKVSDQ